MKHEEEVTEPRLLVMEYTVRCRYRATVMPGMGGVGRAIEDALRPLYGQPNIDPESIRFRIEGDS